MLPIPSPDFMRLLLDSSPDPVCSTNADGVLTYANPAALQRLGVRRLEDVLGHSLEELLPPDVLPEGTPLREGDAEVGTLWRFRPISAELEAARRQLEVERAKLKALLEQAPLPLALLSGPDHAFQFVSRQYREWFLPGREHLGRAAADVLPEAAEQGFIKLLDRVRAEGKRYVGQETPFELVERDGGRREFFFNFVYEPIRDERGEVDSILAVISDVTEQVRARELQIQARRQVEQAAQELETERLKLEMMIEASPFGVALMRGPDLIFEKVNAQWRRYVSEREFIGRPHRDVYPELRGTELHERFRHTLESGEAFAQSELMVRLETAPGTFSDEYFDVSFAPVEDALGKPYGIFAYGLNVTDRVRSKAALQASQSDLLDTLDSMSDAFFSMDANWTIQRVNVHMQQVTGLAASEQVGKNFLELFLPRPEHRQSTFWVKYHEAMERRVPLVFEDYYPPLDLWAEVRTYPKADGGLAVFYTDIGERKRNEAALAHERYKLESIFHETPAAMALWRGADLIFDKVNPVYQALFEGRPLLGLPLLDALPELRGQIFPDLLRGVLETGEAFFGRETLAKLVTRQGGDLEDRYFDFAYVQIQDPDGKPYGVYDHAVDVTDRVMARRQLEASEALLRANQEQLSRAVAVSKIGFFDWNIPEDKILLSEQMQADWGLASGGAMGEALACIHAEDREQTARLVQAAMDDKLPYRAEYRVVRPDATIWVEAQGEVFYNDEGQPIRFFGTALDITERKLHEQELEAARAAAELANETKSAFLANMSHEIRTPLGSILGFTDLLKQPNLDAEEREQFLDIISRNGRGLTRLIDDILDLAKVESGKLMIEEMDFSFVGLVREVLELFSEKVRDKGLFLDLQLAPETPEWLRSDPTRLRQILINIVGNAVKFTQQGGVRLRVSSHPLDGSYRRWNVEVEDTGVGIAAEHRSQLFQPFVQADSTTTRKYGGTGLGLVLSNRLAQALGGGVRLEPLNDAPGCTFVIEFVAGTAGQQSVTSGEQETCDQEVPLRGMRILLADDSADNRLFIERTLTSLGAVVATADNGEVLCQMALANNYAVLLVDLQMPVMDGYEATRRLRAAGYRKPIIALTAHAMAEERARTRAAGCDGHLTKPIQHQDLLTTLSRLTSLS